MNRYRIQSQVWQVLLCLFFAVPIAAADPAPGWVQLGDAPYQEAMDVDTMVRHGNDVYVGGNFLQIGSVAAHHVAHWDGQAWHAMGAGTPSPRAMAVGQDGKPYVAVFTGGGPDVLRWNGSQWLPVKQGVGSDVVSALVTDATGNLYAGGSFAAIAGVPMRNVARWDGSQWLPLGVGVADGITALALDGQGRLYAGVCLQDYVNSEIDYLHGYVTRWNGSSWQILGGDTALGCIESLVVNAGGEVFAAGERGNNGIEGTYLARWNGSAWVAMPNGGYYEITRLGMDHDDLYAIGGFTRHCGGASPYCYAWVYHLLRWNGSDWQVSGVEFTMSSRPWLFDSEGNLLVGGRVKTWDGSFSALVGKWLFVDGDADGVGDAFDDLPANPAEWRDTDHDRVGNNADADDDDDGIPDALDPLRGWIPLSRDAGYSGSAISERTN